MDDREYGTAAAVVAVLLAVATGLFIRHADRPRPVVHQPPSAIELPLPAGPFEYHYSTWYGPGKGLRNRDGSPFKGDRLTCASNVFRRRTVLDLEFRGATVRVLVNDFGPTTYKTHPLYNEVHDDGRRWTSLDCSRATADALGFRRHGKARIKVRVVRSTGRYPGNRYDVERWDLRNVPRP